VTVRVTQDSRRSQIWVDGDVDVNDLGDNFKIKDGDFSTDANTGYSIHNPSDASNHERPNHLRLKARGFDSAPTLFGVDTWADVAGV
jgi:hypothetical protein